MEIKIIFLWMAIFSPLIPLISLWVYKKQFPKKLFVLLLSMLILDISTDLISVYAAVNNIFTTRIFQVYVVFFGVIILLIYRNEFRSLTTKKTLSWIILIFVFYSLYGLFVKKGLHELIPSPYIVLGIIVILISSFYFYRTFIQLEISKITHHYFFWINSAFLIYFSSTFFLAVFEDEILRLGREVGNSIWGIQHFFTIIFNIILAKGIWVSRRV